VLAVAVDVVLTVRFAGTGPAGASRIDRALIRPRVFGRSPLEPLIWIGEPVVVVVLALATAVLAAWYGRRRLAALAVLGPGLTGIATTALKPIIDRTIGPADELSFPSGHTAGAAALGLVAALAICAVARPRPRTTLALLATLPLGPAALAGTGMVLLGAHYPTDVIGGFATAVAIVLGCALVLDAAAPPRPG
jgi:undecaprenyl-diphosphatase